MLPVKLFWLFYDKMGTEKQGEYYDRQVSAFDGSD